MVNTRRPRKKPLEGRVLGCNSGICIAREGVYEQILLYFAFLLGLDFFIKENILLLNEKKAITCIYYI